MFANNNNNYGHADSIGMTITNEDMSRLTSSQVFLFDPPARINSLDYFHNGESLIIANDDGTLLLCDALEGRIKNKFYAKKYGMGNVRFTHHPTAVVGSPTLNKFDCSIRYLSLHDNTYLREYRGHTDTVNSIAISPIDDTMISASWDNTLRIWDLRAPNCVGTFGAVFPPRTLHHLAFDVEGGCFGVASGSHDVKLYDLRMLAEGAFADFAYPAPENNDCFTSVVFSHDQRLIAMGTEGQYVLLADAFKGGLMHKFEVKNAHHCELGVAFSPDSKYLLTGNDDGSTFIWSLKAGDEFKLVSTIEGHVGPVSCVQWNPAYLQCATSCSNALLWGPNPIYL